MKLKEIKPGMAIHCKTIEEAKNLVELTNSAPAFLRSWGGEEVKTCYRMDNGKINGFSSAFYYKENGYEIVEFSDLIIPELTVEEVLSILAEIGDMCNNIVSCDKCPLSAENVGAEINLCNIEEFKGNAQKLIEICQKWKSDHQKKEPEVEWVYRVFGAENFGEKFFDTEEKAIKRCEELAKTQKTKKYTRYERVCRVKEDR